MAVTAKQYGLFLKQALGAQVNILSDTIKVMLTTSTYVPDQDVHDFKDDVTNEITGTGYTATGVQIANDTLTYTSGTNVLKYDGDDVSWSTATFTARIAVIYDATPSTDATRPLIGYIDFGADVSPVAGTFTIQFDANGIYTFTAA